LKKGEYDLAIKILKRRSGSTPNYAKAFISRAETYEKKNAYDRAVRDYDEAIRLEPNLKTHGMDAVGPAPSLVNWQAALEDCN